MLLMSVTVPFDRRASVAVNAKACQWTRPFRPSGSVAGEAIEKTVVIAFF